MKATLDEKDPGNNPLTERRAVNQAKYGLLSIRSCFKAAYCLWPCFCYHQRSRYSWRTPLLRAWARPSSLWSPTQLRWVRGSEDVVVPLLMFKQEKKKPWPKSVLWLRALIMWRSGLRIKWGNGWERKTYLSRALLIPPNAAAMLKENLITPAVKPYPANFPFFKLKKKKKRITVTTQTLLSGLRRRFRSQAEFFLQSERWGISALPRWNWS